MKTLILLLLTGAAFGQELINGSRTIAGTVNYCADAGSTDAYDCTITGLTAYMTGGEYSIKANTANTGAATVNLSAIGAKTIVKREGGITTALADNDIRAGQMIHLTYDGTNMQCSDCNGNALSGGAAALTGSTGDGLWPNDFYFPTAQPIESAGRIYVVPMSMPTAMQFRAMRLYIAAGSAAGTATACGMFTRASNGTLTAQALTSAVVTATSGTIVDFPFASGSLVSGGIATLPAAMNYVAVCGFEGTPQIWRHGEAQNYLFIHNGWNGAYSEKRIAYATSGLTGGGTGLTLPSSITAGSLTAAQWVPHVWLVP